MSTDTLSDRLLVHHLSMLRDGSGLPDDIIRERGYRSLTAVAEVRRLGFTERQAIVPGLLIPLWDVNGEVTSYLLRPDEPRAGSNGKLVKYEQPRKARAVLDVPPRCRPVLRDPRVTLYVTEGSKKADALAARDACAISLSGVWNWRGTNELGGKMALPDWDGIALDDRLVRIVFDSDVASKREVAYAVVRLKGFLEQRHAVVEVVYLPATSSGDKQGVDDFLAAGGTLQDLDAFASAELRRSPNEEGAQPSIVVNRRFLHEVVDDCWKILTSENRRRISVFSRDGRLCRIAENDHGQMYIHDWTADDLPFVLERLARFVRVTDEGAQVPDRMPQDVVADMMVAWKKPVPQLRGIVGTPVFGSDGTLVTTAGYQEKTTLFYRPTGQPVPTVPARPTLDDVARATALLVDEWLFDFPFADLSSRANALAAPLTVVARELIRGCTPLFAIDAPAPGTGKGYLAASIAITVTGAPPAVMTEVHDEDEMRKRITALLRDGGQINLIDNIKRPLQSAQLAAVLTAPTWADRLLGKSETLRLPNRATWLATGNNLRLDGEVMRRTAWIRLDARVDRPWERQLFKHDPLMAWVRQERHHLVWALLVLVQNWLALGRPAWSGQAMGTFEEWSAVIGGILSAAGIEDFLANREELYRNADSETEDWRAFILAWAERFDISPVKASELLPFLKEEELLPSVLASIRGDVTDQKIKIRLGRALGERRDRRIGGYFLRCRGHDAHQKGQVYALESAESEGTEAQLSAHSPHDNRSTPDSFAESAESAESVWDPPRACEEHASRATRDLCSRGADREGADRSPHSPHSPPPDSDSWSEPAESGLSAVNDSPQHFPQDRRCRGCGLLMSVVALSDHCGRCLAAARGHRHA